jgi:hypothetical protein
MRSARALALGEDPEIAELLERAERIQQRYLPAA